MVELHRWSPIDGDLASSVGSTTLNQPWVDWRQKISKNHPRPIKNNLRALFHLTKHPHLLENNQGTTVPPTFTCSTSGFQHPTRRLVAKKKSGHLWRGEILSQQAMKSPCHLRKSVDTKIIHVKSSKKSQQKISLIKLKVPTTLTLQLFLGWWVFNWNGVTGNWDLEIRFRSWLLTQC